MKEITRKDWEQIVDKLLYEDDEPKVIINARKKLFMDLFDSYVKEE